MRPTIGAVASSASLPALFLSLVLGTVPGFAEDNPFCPLDCMPRFAEKASECRELFEEGDPLLDDCYQSALIDYWRCLLRCGTGFRLDAARSWGTGPFSAPRPSQGGNRVVMAQIKGTGSVLVGPRE